MLFIHFIFAGLPLTWAFGPIGLQAYKLQKDCQVDCSREGLSECECQNARALRCAKPNTPILQQECHLQIAKYPTAPSKLETKTRKYKGTAVPNAASGSPPRPVPPTRSSAPSKPTQTVTPVLQGSRPWPLPQPTEVPERPVSQMCGSLGFRPCPNGQVCVDNPFVEDCFTALDCAGYCARLNDSICGPVFEVACPIEGQICVHDPREICWGKVCPGTCVFLDTERTGAVIV